MSLFIIHKKLQKETSKIPNEIDCQSVSKTHMHKITNSSNIHDDSDDDDASEAPTIGHLHQKAI